MLPGDAPVPARRRREDALRRLRLTVGWRRPGVRRALLATAGGLLLYAGHPPVDLAVAGPLAFVPLLALARDVGSSTRAVRRGFGWGFCAGLIFFAPLLVWLIPFGYAAWVLLAVLQALFVAAWLAGVAWFGSRRGRAVFAVAWWVALEAARSAWPVGGFAWGVLGASQHDGGPLLGVARTLGVLGVSAACAALAVAMEALVARARGAWPTSARAGVAEASVPRGIAPLRGARDPDRVFLAIRAPFAAGIGVLVAAVLLAGEPPAPTDTTVDIAAVQAARIRETGAAGVTRLDTDRILAVADLVLDATRPLADDPPDVTVWAENSLDADIRDPRNAELRARVVEALALLDGGPLLAGGIFDGEEAGTAYNVVAVLAADGDEIEVGDFYRKRQPVPFGEYVPLRSVLGGLPPLRVIGTDIIGGPAAQTIDVAGARIGAVICFENAFTDLVRDQVRAGADVLIVVTNNSSFGTSPMSEQHLALSQIRAVETGRWVVHAGLSGISGVIDPNGKVVSQTELLADAITRADIPLIEGLTPSMRLSQWVGPAAALLSVALAAMALAAASRRVVAPPEPHEQQGEAKATSKAEISDTP